MRSRLGMFAYYQKKGGWGAGPLTLPGGIGYQYTYLLTYLLYFYIDYIYYNLLAIPTVEPPFCAAAELLSLRWSKIW